MLPEGNFSDIGPTAEETSRRAMERVSHLKDPCPTFQRHVHLVTRTTQLNVARIYFQCPCVCHSEQWATSTNEIISLWNVVVQLHDQFPSDRLPRISSDHSTLDVISTCTGPEVGRVVNRALQKHLDSRNAQIAALRAFMVYPFTGDDESWTVLEWRETNGTEAIGIFDVGNQDEFESCSSLMHFRAGTQGHPDGDHRTRTWLVWNVTGMSILKMLFQVAQHVLGILRLPKEDSVSLYCVHENNETPSAKE